MKKMHLVAIVLALLFLALPGSAQARVIANVQIPISGPMSSSPCEPETVMVDGTARMVIREEVDGNGGFHQGFHFNLQRIGGIGLSSGDRYSFQNTFNLEANVPAGEFREFTITQNVAAHRQGSGDNFRLHVTSHLTINANGEVTVEFFKMEFACQG